MTTEQVIKDMNACLRFDDYGDRDRDCIECSQENWRVCKDNLMKQALDLINQQEAKIEALEYAMELLKNGVVVLPRDVGDDVCTLSLDCSRGENQELRQLVENLQARIDALNHTNKILMDTEDAVKMNVRNFAIKEFAERLKFTITINNTSDGYLDYAIDYNCLMEDIDNLVKEMTEEKENDQL